VRELDRFVLLRLLLGHGPESERHGYKQAFGPILVKE
jgi:hypothetical protein